MNFGNPQCVGAWILAGSDRFQHLGPALERHELFPERTTRIRRIESPVCPDSDLGARVGPTLSSGTGSAPR